MAPKALEQSPARFSTHVLNKWRQLRDITQLQKLCSLCSQASNVKRQDIINTPPPLPVYLWLFTGVIFRVFFVSYIVASNISICVIDASFGTTGLPLSSYAASRFDTGGGLQNKTAIVSENIAGS